nr:excalibur calcium-binding domain-containing protein [uncultured Sphingorhabdus sp.]
MRIIIAAISLLLLNSADAGNAHGGRTDATGCHNDKNNGGRHCHGGSDAPTRPLRALGGSAVYFANCTAARAAGAAPVRAGQPGYARHLDRDGDGVGCEN